jgi:mRNA-degrading endonuclease RelE of RelBE toxin-antitoxin system
VNEEVPWRVDTTPDFEREFGKLDPTIQRRIAAYLLDVTQLPNPRQRGNAATH